MQKNNKTVALFLAFVMIFSGLQVALPYVQAEDTKLVDCSFDSSDSVSPWGGKASFVWNSTGDRSGGGALEATSVTNGGTITYSQKITLKKGYTYQLSYWMKGDAAVQIGVEPGYAGLSPSKIQVEDGGQYRPGVYFQTPASDEWKQVTHEITIHGIQVNATGAEAETAQATFYFLIKEDGTNLWLDDITVTEVAPGGEEVPGDGAPERISLEANADHYTEGTQAFALNVKYYNQDGEVSSVQDAVITSSNPSVFQVEGNQLTPKETGYSVITAEYEGLSASMVMVCTPEDMAFKDESSIPEDYKVGEGGQAGHDGGQAYWHSSAGTAGDWKLRAYVGRASKWFESGYRYMSGWFYDDMGAASRAALYMDIEDSATYHEDFATNYSYGNYNWAGKNYYQAKVTAGLVNANAENYHYMNGANQVDIAPRTKGWHQLSAMLVQDIASPWGWSAVFYLDGKEFLRQAITPQDSTTTESCFELRAQNYGVNSYYDDLFMTGNVDAFDINEQPTLIEKTVYRHDFEGSLDDWTASSKGSGSLTASGGLEDSGAFQATNCTSGFQFLYGKKLSVSNGKRYRLSAWVKSSSEVKALMGIEFSDSDKVTVTPSIYKRISSNGTWQQIVNEITILDIQDGNGNPLSESATGTFFVRFEGDTAEAWLDRVELVEYDTTKPPVVESVVIKGSPMLGSELAAEAVITDPEGDELAPALYQWQRSSDGAADWNDITGATQQAYTCVQQDLGQYLRVIVTPKSTLPPVTGETAISQATKQIIDTVTPPSAENVSVNGDPGAGKTLTADYTFQKSDDGGEEGQTTFLWEVSDQVEGSYTAVSEEKTYVPTFSDCGKYIRVTVTPVDENGVVGAPVVSDAVLIPMVDEYAFYVAKDGDDANNGTADAPFATLERAKQAVREIDKSNLTKGISVYLREGEYVLEKSVSFDAQDSGTEQYPVTYQAYPGEKVRILGAKLLDSSCVSPVTDEAVLNRVLDPAAKAKIKQIDLGSLGIASIPEIEDYGFGVKTDYSPVEIYFDGVALSQSRWPNDDFTRITSAKVNGDNYREDSFTLGYLDEENHTAQWDADALKDLYVSGFIGNDWAGVTHKLAEIDPDKKTVTSVGGTSYTPSSNHKIYFFNLIEEIDMPGESYIDREKNIVYFYPYHDDLSDVEIAVADMAEPLLSLNGTKYISFEDLYLDTTRNNAINAQNVSNMVVDGCEIGHTAANAVTLNGTDCTIQNCHIYDLGRGGITISGGDRVNLISSNHVIRNNRMHRGERVYNSYVPLISVSNSVGVTIESNQLYDSKHQLVQFANSNDILFQYNEVYDAVNQAADMAAVYWGRNPSVLGIEIKYNYFHHIGNSYGGYGQQAIFWDDGSYGPVVYGNIFYRATRTADQGGSTNNHCYPLKTYGGQFSRIENNIIVDAPTAFRYSHWNDWYEWVYDKSESKNSGIWSRLTSAGFDSDIWKEHYKDTPWQYLNQYFSTELKNEIDPLTGDALKQFIAEHKQPDVTNVFEGNVLAKVDEVIQGGRVLDSNTYQIPDNEAESSFVSYGTDFKLTDAALAKVKGTIPDFENIPTEQIGLMPVNKNGTTLLVGGSAPSVSEAKISGDDAVLQVNYDFDDPDGDKEGFSEISWWISSDRDGEYTKIPGESDTELLLNSAYEGKYIKCQVTPIDIRMIDGEPVETMAVLAGSEVVEPDKSELSAAIQEAESLLASAVVGTQPGNYYQTAVDRFRLAVDQAKMVLEDDNVYQSEIDEAVAQLNDAKTTFENSAIKQSPTPSPTPTPPGQNGGNNGTGGNGTGGIANGGIVNTGVNRPTATPVPTQGFTDIIGHWAEEDINEMAQKGLISGVTSTAFEPDRAITRAEFATLIARGLNLNSSVSAGFHDVQAGVWYTNYVNAAASAGLINGYDDYFRPDDLITREEMAVIIVKAYLFQGGQSQRNGLEQFIDQEDISSWARDYVDQAVGAGLIYGMTSNTFVPAENATRAQAASLLKRLINMSV